MNEEKAIAKTLIEAQKMREESYIKGTGRYALEIEHCLIECSKQNKLSPNLWSLLTLAMSWWNDVQLWCEDVLADRIIDITPDADDEYKEEIKEE